MRNKLRAIPYIMVYTIRLLFFILFYPFRMLYRGVRWLGRAIGRGFMAVIRGIIATPMAVIRTPMRMYRRVTVWRNWLLAKVEYLQSESQKWRTTFNILKSPYSFLRMMGFSPQMAAGLLFAGSTVGTGVVVNETILAEPSFSAGDHGIYTAPSDFPVTYSDKDNTLKIQLGTTPVGEISISDVSVGTAYANSALPAGESHPVMIGGSTSSATYLEVGELTIDRWRCDQFVIQNSEAHTLRIIGNASDGQSISASPGTPRKRAISGGNRADSMITKGGFYDQIKIEAPNSSVNGRVDKLTLSNLWTKGGPCLVNRVKAGTLTIELSEFGRGNGFAAKDFTVATTTIFKVFVNEDNVETAITQVP